MHVKTLPLIMLLTDILLLFVLIFNEMSSTAVQNPAAAVLRVFVCWRTRFSRFLSDITVHMNQSCLCIFTRDNKHRPKPGHGSR